MKIEQYIPDQDKLELYVKNGIVTASPHPRLPLLILTYGRSAVYENLWDDVTTKCRGLIIDRKGIVIARPFEKFFNVATSYRPETWLENLPKVKPDTFEKLDGSLGILYRYNGETGIASKGSFKSDHANWATGFYMANHKDAIWPEGYTPVFEMICQEVQTHVVHYKEDDHLALTALVNIETGEELNYDSLCVWAAGNNVPVVEKFDKTVGDVLAEDRQNKEGYVLSWPRPGETPLKVKVKHETFLAMQKIAHAATPKAILGALCEGQDEQIDLWSASANPEIASFVQGHATRFRKKYLETLSIAAGMAQVARNKYGSRKDQAAYLTQDDGHRFYSGIAFALLDLKAPETIRKAVWKVAKILLADELSDKPAVGVDEEDAEEV